ncbi:MAG: ABC transporter permease subunit [Rhodospirillaceae bacterium]|nr:ABC transporter permease subunit [Rhodospirillaceae bacterium]
MLAVFPPLTLFLFLMPVLAGLGGVVLPAFGYFPPLGGDVFSLAPWRQMMAEPGVGTAITVSLTTGFGATLLTLVLALAVAAAWHDTKIFAALRRHLAPLLAVPHAAFAIGFAFLAAPSGWMARLLSPWLTGWRRPPDIASVQDEHGLALLIALVCKEIFFLLLMILAALGQVNADKLIAAARGLGYGPVAAWCKVVLPLVYRQIRLPVYAVLAYGLSVVDMAIILGPTTPPTFAVMVLNWFQAPELGLRFQAAVGALLLLLMAIGAIAVWRCGEIALAYTARGVLSNGVRRFADRTVTWMSGALLGLIFLITAASILALVVWSFTDVWRFPAAVPQEFAVSAWRGVMLADPLAVTAGVGIVVTVIALLAVTGCLENELHNGVSPTQRSLVLLYLPLLVPQVSFLSGLQILFVVLNIDGTLLAVMLCHLAFVLPYVFLVLADPYRTLDPRYARTAATLGASPWRIFREVRLPLLMKAILAAAAVGFAVSVGQYLATLLPGAGRVTSVTTDVMNALLNGDRRIVGIYGLIQMALPVTVFMLAVLAPYRPTLRTVPS